MAKSNSGKWPPKFESDCSHDTWKRDDEIWCELTDFDEMKRALAMYLSLTDRARI